MISLVEAKTCYHCHLPAPSHDLWTTEHKGETLRFCCPACLTICETILKQNLDHFYQLLDTSLPSAQLESIQASPSLQAPIKIDTDDFTPTSQLQYVKRSNDVSEATFIVENIHCAACAWLIERRLSKEPDVIDFNVNLSLHRLWIRWKESKLPLKDIALKLAQLNYRIIPYREDKERAYREKEKQASLKRLVVSGLGMMQVMMYSVGLYAGALQGISQTFETFLRWVSLLVTTAVLFYAGLPILKSAYRSLINRLPSMDLPVSIALLLCYSASLWATIKATGEVYFDAISMFVFFLGISRFIEMRVRHANTEFTLNMLTSIKRPVWKLINNTPGNTSSSTDHSWVQVSASNLKVDDIISIKAGTQIPVDCEIIKGSTQINRTMITGEITPIDVTTGDILLSGSENLTQPIEARVVNKESDSQLQQIANTFDQVNISRSKNLRIADKLAPWFSLSVIVVAVIVFSVWHRLDPENAFWITLSVLVVTCPCALSLATPTAVTSCIQAFSRRGILIQNPTALDKLSSISHWVFDKTGTLTEGNFSITDIDTYIEEWRNSVAPIAKLLEANASHPLAKAFQNLSSDEKWQVIDIEHDTQGISACLMDQDARKIKCKIGSKDFVTPFASNASVFSEHKDVDIQENVHQTYVYLAIQHVGCIARFTLTDRLRTDAINIINQLNQDYATILLTGDASIPADKLTKGWYLSQSHINQSPEKKVEKLQKLKSQHKKVAMVGDGINDCLALKAADISISFRNGADMAKNSADILLLTPGLSAIKYLLEHTTKMHRIIKQNIAWAIGYNLTMLPLAACGFIPTYVAAIGMSISSLVVVLNARRLN